MQMILRYFAENAATHKKYSLQQSNGYGIGWNFKSAEKNQKL